ncbi:transcription factor domain-containing protein [Aspergillus lucknowensis]|uniref:Fungal-specific transcription factor domain-containing protein n=1 Tax=Aspergillus lucknowensis TaxID=176173 RepID=A0ABR4LNQ6_9EURO
MPPLKSFARRRHATMACVSCRESKVKCDGAEPACSNCANRNRECRYQAVDKRKLPLRVAIELLSNRVDQLCRFIRDNGLQPPPMSEERDLALGKVLEMLGLNEINSSLGRQFPCAAKPLTEESKDVLPAAVGLSAQGFEIRQSSGALPETQSINFGQTQPALPPALGGDASAMPFRGDCHNSTDINPNADPASWDWQLGLDARTAPVTPYVEGCLNSSSPGAPLSTGFETLSEPFEPMIADDDQTLVDESSSTEDIEGLIDELSNRVGTLQIAPGGRTQFYGPTSTFNLADMVITANSKTQSVAQNDALECLSRLGTNKIVPSALEVHLLNLYFCWQDPSFHVVDRKIYEHAMEKWYAMEDTPFYSESLRNAMCAVGASFETRYHPNFVTFPKSLVDFFAERAKALLETELDSACVATVQSMVILSSLETASGRDARGWLYSGMAIRLAFDLALHLDMSSYISSGIITTADADLRRTVFWAAYTVDHQLGFHLGRPFRTNMEDVTVGKTLSKEKKPEHDKWVPYISPDSLYTATGVPDCMDAICEQQITLCEIMAPCGYILYGTSSISKVVLQQLNEKIVTRLLKWKAKLPQMLQIDLGDHSSPYTPQTLLLHMQYYQNMIYAHRPWMSKSRLQPQPPQGPGHRHAREMCIQSAISIARILVMYEARYTLRRIHTKAVAITSSAVLLLLFAAVTQYPSGRDDITSHLSTCFRALDEFSISWSCASRAKDLLLRLQRRWEIRTRSSKKNHLSEYFYLPRTGQSPTSNEFYNHTEKDHEMSVGQQPVPDGEFNIGTDIDWMLTSDEQCQSDDHTSNLYSLLSNPVTHP